MRTHVRQPKLKMFVFPVVGEEESEQDVEPRGGVSAELVGALACIPPHCARHGAI